MNFTTATAVNPSSDGYTAEFVDGWDVRSNANGGYLMAIGARAMAARAGPTRSR